MSSLAIFNARNDSAGTIAGAVDEHGYAIVTGMIDPGQVATLRGELAPHFEVSRLGSTGFLGGKTQRFNNLFMRAPTTRDMIMHPLLLAVADIVLLRWCARYQVNYTGVMHLLPGEQAQVLHRDAFYYPFRSPGPVTVLNSIWAVSDFTAENGATRLVPGSHLSGRNPDPQREDYPVVQAIVPAGSAVIWEGRTWHAAGLNRSNGPRIGLTTYFCGPQFRQMANLTYGAKKPVVDAMSADMKALIGLKSWSGYGRTSDKYNDLVESGDQLVGELRA